MTKSENLLPHNANSGVRENLPPCRLYLVKV
jgi:hypothetical protein